MRIDLETVSFSGGGSGLSGDQTQSKEIRKQNEATAWGSQKSTGTLKREKEGAEEKRVAFWYSSPQAVRVAVRESIDTLHSQSNSHQWQWKVLEMHIFNNQRLIKKTGLFPWIDYFEQLVWMNQFKKVPDIPALHALELQSFNTKFSTSKFYI